MISRFLGAKRPSKVIKKMEKEREKIASVDRRRSKYEKERDVRSKYRRLKEDRKRRENELKQRKRSEFFRQHKSTIQKIGKAANFTGNMTKDVVRTAKGKAVKDLVHTGKAAIGTTADFFGNWADNINNENFRTGAKGKRVTHKTTTTKKIPASIISNGSRYRKAKVFTDPFYANDYASDLHQQGIKTKVRKLKNRGNSVYVVYAKQQSSGFYYS